jgi:pimeloyl-ACP methyl ester carboxylesterase
MGLPSPPMILETRLTLDLTGRPLRYESQAQGKRMLCDFLSGRVTLPDGSRQTVDCAGAGYVLDNNHPGQIALMLVQCLPSSRDSMRPRVFLVPGLTTLDYGMTQQEDGTWTSDLGETLHLSSNGALHRIVAAGGLVTIERLPVAPPLPDLDHAAPAEAEYEPPADLYDRMQDIEIERENHAHIGATLTFSPKPLGGVLMLQGSGAVDRHEFSSGIDTGTHVFADALARAGFSVLRFDKRGVGASRQADDTLGELGHASMVDDAAAALDRLQSVLPEGSPVILVGHSLGGITALAVSVQRAKGNIPLVLLATPGRALPQVMAAQIRSQGQRLGLTPEHIAQQLAELDHFTDFSRAKVDPGDVRASAQAGRLFRKSFADLADLDPAALVSAQRAAIAIAQGGHDAQVDPAEDYARLLAAARMAHVPCEARVFPTLNHLFRASDPDEGFASYADRRPVDAEAVAWVVDWCLRCARQ